ncbi:MAG: hypothetical protein OSB43_12355 [Nocardioides sp.]|uniref:hypothetical protein n=1 Tax=Nocardioides sp. TaxID=35761 RepID=UPI00238508ED|nr:hypothetical protein [Nocardioides sp.]MDE0777059.1 hypothetical protein [Nocardioides sp.]
MLLTATACSDAAGRPVSRLADLELEAYSRVSYEPGTVFSFSLTSVETPVDGRIEDPNIDVDGSGLEVLGFAVTPPGVPDFDVAAGFLPTRRNLMGSTQIDTASIAADSEGVRLMVGLRVVSGEYTEVHDISYSVVAEDGGRLSYKSAVGLGQCFDDGREEHECPKAWVEGGSQPPS